MHNITICPACDGRELIGAMQVQDKSVSHETFSLLCCRECSLLITSPQPDAENLPTYYESTTYISHSNSTKGIFNKLYQTVRQSAVRNKLRLISRYAKERTILDYGCGTGHFLAACKAAGFSIAGVEPNATARETAKNITNGTIEPDLSKVNDKYNIITLWHVLEHVQDLNETLSAIIHHLEQNGTMFIAVPNHLSYDAKVYQELWAAYDVPRHLWHFNVKSMDTLLKKHHLEIKEIIPMKFDSFYVSMLSEQYRAQRQSIVTMVRGAMTGLLSNLSAKRTNYSSQIFVIHKK